MSIFSKLFGKRAEERESSSTMPAVSDLVVDTEFDERPEELLARREESMGRIMVWLEDVAGNMHDIMEQLKSQGTSLSAFEHNSRLQLDTLRQLNVTLDSQNRFSSEMAESLRGLPRLAALMPEATRNQSAILERLGTELEGQAGKAQELLDTFKEVSGKLDKIPNGNAEQAKILGLLSEKVDKAVEQELQMRQNMQTLGEVLTSMNEFTKEQAESLEAIQNTTRTAIENTARLSNQRFKVTAALLAALIGIVMVLGIIAIVRLGS